MMLSMNRLPLALLVPALGFAQAPLRTPEAVAAAERAFAELAGKVGTPAAFLANLTEDALVFTPKAENGHAVQRAQKGDGSRLSWAPEHVELAASGDFAISTGPWQWRPGPGDAPAAQGHFLSLWVLRGERWRVLLDVGTPHPEQPPVPLHLKALASSPQPGAQASLAAAWRAFDVEGAADFKVALKRFGNRDLRLYRKGRRIQAGLWALGTGAAVAWTEEGSHVATSVDLAVRWGIRKTAVGVSSAVQVWRRNDLSWELILDVELPLPAPES